MSETTRGKSNVDTRLEEEIEGGWAKLTRSRIRISKYDKYIGPALWSERWTGVANLKLIKGHAVRIQEGYITMLYDI